MRYILALTVLLLLAGCGSSQASGKSSATATPGQISFSHAPKMTIDRNAHYSATVRTNMGAFTITLLPKVAPITVNNFVFLARHDFYNGVIFHRVVPGFMIQGGDPTGTGTGGPGYVFQDEKVTMPYTRGTVAMANTGAKGTNGSQFFIVVAPKAYWLKPTYTIFGKVTAGMNVVMKIANVPLGPSVSNPQEVSSPLSPVTMESVTIHESK